MIHSRLKLTVLVGFMLAFAAIPSYAQKENRVFVKQIEVVGNTVLSSKEIKAVVSPYEGKSLTFSQMRNIASLITKRYHDKGYTLSKAYLPRQKMAGHILKIAVLEARAGKLTITGKHHYYSDKFIRKYFEPLLNDKAFNQHDLERAVLLLNDYPKLKVKVNLKKGAAPDTTDLVVAANNSIPVSAILDYNNFGSKYTSKNRFGATFNIGSLAVPGSMLSMRAIVGNKYDSMHFGRISYSVPLGVRGFRTGAYYGTGNYAVGKDLEVLNIKGTSVNYGIYASYPFIKEVTRSLTGKVGFDVINTKNTMLGQMTSKDKIRTLSLGADYELLTAYSRNFLNFTVTQGLGNVLGGMDNNDPYASRVGADNDFTKFGFSLMRLQKISTPVFLLLKVSGQYSPSNLISYEQFYIGGADSVRGFAQSEYGGDSGYAATAELRIAPLADKKLLQLALFIDNGGIHVNNAVVGQKSSRSLTGIGTGVRLSLPYDFNIRADVGFPISPSKNADGHNMAFYLQATKTFK
ncbi:MAG: heme utilization protein [bacterium]|nr:MAG: heme utilization protein [bacterium]